MTQTLTRFQMLATCIETQGMISSYSIAAWTDSLDMTLDTALDTSHAAIIAYQVCSK